MPPRSWVERVFDVQRWEHMVRGGHFAVLEQPEILADEIRAFFKPLRSEMNRNGIVLTVAMSERQVRSCL